MIKGFVDGIVAIVKLLGGKPSFFKVLTTLLTALPGLIGQLLDLKAEDAKSKADDFLAALEAYTQADTGSIRVFPHMVPDREKEFWHAVETMCRNYIYEELKVDGYYVP